MKKESNMKLKRSRNILNKSKGSILKKKNSIATNEFVEQNLKNNGNSWGDDIIEDKKIGNNDMDYNTDSEESDVDSSKHKRSLMKLKDTDPEFYSYLKQNDTKLLDFNLSDEDDGYYVDKDDRKHIPPDNLEVGSDESDYEFMEDGKSYVSRGPANVTQQLLKIWQNDIQQDSSSKTIKCVVEAFHAAVQTVATDPNETESLRYKVEGSTVFNGVVQLCILQLPVALRRFLKLGSESRFEAHKAKRFVKIKGTLKSYLKDLIRILQNVTSSNVLTILLKHLHEMLPYAQSFSSLSKPLLRILLKFWSGGEEAVCVVAFLSILRFATSRKEYVLETLLKTMYVKYVENAKFVSPNTLPGINFMKHSLTEIYLLDSDLSYNHAFLYIRQLAIHLRNAMTLKKKEHFQAVYNWQYINSLRFWAGLITLSKSTSMLRSLLYPVVQIITGTIKVIPTAQYYPLRFHCVQMLINISRDTGTFIPVLPFVLEILNSYDFNKKHKSVSMKPLSLICLLRMSKVQLQENGFKDSIIETIYQLVLESAAKDSHTIYFSDMYVPCIIQLKAFLKKCRVANYCKKMKQLLEKIEENRKYIDNERAKVTVDLKDMTKIEKWENRIKNDGTSLAKFYASWIKIHLSQKLKLLTQNDEIADYHLPVVRTLKKRKLDEQKEDDDSGNESPLVEKTRKNVLKRRARSESTRKKVNRNNDVEDLPRENTDVVQDTNVNDWE